MALDILLDTGCPWIRRHPGIARASVRRGSPGRVDRRRRARIEAGLGLLSRTGAAVVDSLDYMPTLRNVATRAVFFHNGVIHSLDDAVKFYAQRDTQPLTK